jgi:catechol 2,3-dioxygenase-like lactoylglutathione lyase family enzyme
MFTTSRLSFVTLGVTDIARSTRFYADALGFAVKNARPDVTFFEMGGVQLALYPRVLLAADAGVALPSASVAPSESSAPHPVSPVTTFALACNVASAAAVDTLLDAAARGGGRITRPARQTDWGGYAGYFTDPDGFLWEAAWAPGAGG